MKVEILRKELSEGSVIPKGYGISYLSPYRLSYVCHPFPFNKIIGFLRELWFKHRDYKVLTRDSNIYDHILKRIRKARNEGYWQGRQADVKNRHITRLLKEMKSLLCEVKNDQRL